VRCFRCGGTYRCVTIAIGNALDLSASNSGEEIIRADLCHVAAHLKFPNISKIFAVNDCAEITPVNTARLARLTFEGSFRTVSDAGDLGQDGLFAFATRVGSRTETAAGSASGVAEVPAKAKARRVKAVEKKPVFIVQKVCGAECNWILSSELNVAGDTAVKVGQIMQLYTVTGFQ
jgi:hypothetical protein